MHGPGLVPLGHFLVDDSAAGGHPLHVPGGDDPSIAEAVAVLDVSLEHIGDGLDTPVGGATETP